MSFCGEVGFGLGGGIGVDATANLDKDGTNIKVEAEVTIAGVVGVSAKAKLNNCGKLTYGAGGKIGPARLGWDSNGGWSGGVGGKLEDRSKDVKDLFQTNPARLIKFGGKVAAEGCVRFTW